MIGEVSQDTKTKKASSAKQNGLSKAADDAKPVDLEASTGNSEEEERQKERDKEILKYAKDTGVAHSQRFF